MNVIITRRCEKAAKKLSKRHRKQFDDAVAKLSQPWDEIRPGLRKIARIGAGGANLYRYQPKAHCKFRIVFSCDGTTIELRDIVKKNSTPLVRWSS